MEKIPLSFQYPQADRRGCNRKSERTDGNHLTVSVSTSGSKGVQQTLQKLERSNYCTSFSIHKRIEGGATIRSCQPLGVARKFQYPQADRRGCNWAGGLVGWRLPVFQYPQADRRGCNYDLSLFDTPFCIVSVSTSGSKGVQPVLGLKTM